ncbi:hypothetical protein B0T26DRAFT_681052 [Lasiosphaeria miniovina]|uniref:Uncharacterized protein n=1 Tax=Lasiosphaeria miniovina TaxID=1954250 RepID=A0AA40DKP5_9PEZI|nr:uncharacterized protein B0T26DRAFT_681052 [Lasiosphaeria miniovina]KAK0703368.1 hypothetical protein B0T26DRAFT_681052 [Lasiosphaeria miniovina]
MRRAPTAAPRPIPRSVPLTPPRPPLTMLGDGVAGDLDACERPAPDDGGHQKSKDKVARVGPSAPQLLADVPPWVPPLRPSRPPPATRSDLGARKRPAPDDGGEREGKHKVARVGPPAPELPADFPRSVPPLRPPGPPLATRPPPATQGDLSARKCAAPDDGGGQRKRKPKVARVRRSAREVLVDIAVAAATARSLALAAPREPVRFREVRWNEIRWFAIKYSNGDEPPCSPRTMPFREVRWNQPPRRRSWNERRGPLSPRSTMAVYFKDVRWDQPRRARHAEDKSISPWSDPTGQRVFFAEVCYDKPRRWRQPMWVDVSLSPRSTR